MIGKMETKYIHICFIEAELLIAKLRFCFFHIVHIQLILKNLWMFLL